MADDPRGEVPAVLTEAQEASLRKLAAVTGKDAIWPVTLTVTAVRAIVATLDARDRALAAERAQRGRLEAALSLTKTMLFKAFHFRGYGPGPLTEPANVVALDAAAAALTADPSATLADVVRLRKALQSAMLALESPSESFLAELRDAYEKAAWAGD